MQSLQSIAWLYPALETVHIVGIALLVGNLVLLEIRAWGIGGVALPLMPLARLSMGIALSGFGLAALSGLVMFALQPAELLANRAFNLKMLLLVVAGCNAAWFHARGSLVRMDGLARAQMGLSMLVWLAVITCGRWIGYL
ncbi:MAG: hypothetical protein J0H69_09310 [Burkholderiales bacterium]|nr:hypothetical protein [Burkholderiales bacterium]